MQRGPYFWQFKDHNSGRRHEKQTINPILFICFSSPNCLWNSFLQLKIIKIHFYGLPALVHSGLQNTWILEVKAVRLGFCTVWFRKHTLEESKKTGFIFSIKLRINSKIFREVSWSRVFNLKKIPLPFYGFRQISAKYPCHCNPFSTKTRHRKVKAKRFQNWGGFIYYYALQDTFVVGGGYQSAFLWRWVPCQDDQRYENVGSLVKSGLSFMEKCST